ncbi:MAG: hypothetical protein K2J32_09590 [Ruminococcus sp.]|nr:hypothetical protein [Ruminococcus sp.]
MKIEEALQKFMDNKEDCTVTLKNSDAVDGKITEIGEGFIRIEEDGGLIERVVNIQYIVSVYVYHTPEKKKKDKKKSIF